MRSQVCRLVCEDAPDIGPGVVVSLQEAGRMVGTPWWKLRQLVDDGQLTLLMDAEAPQGWAWRWLLLRSEVEELAEDKGPGSRRGGRSW